MTQTVTLNKPDELGTITVTWPVFAETSGEGGRVQCCFGTEVEATFERGEETLSRRWVVHSCGPLGKLWFARRVARAIHLARRFVQGLHNEWARVGRETRVVVEGECEPEPEPCGHEKAKWRDAEGGQTATGVHTVKLAGWYNSVGSEYFGKPGGPCGYCGETLPPKPCLSPG